MTRRQVAVESGNRVLPPVRQRHDVQRRRVSSPASYLRFVDRGTGLAVLVLVSHDRRSPSPRAASLVRTASCGELAKGATRTTLQTAPVVGGPPIGSASAGVSAARQCRRPLSARRRCARPRLTFCPTLGSAARGARASEPLSESRRERQRCGALLVPPSRRDLLAVPAGNHAQGC